MANVHNLSSWLAEAGGLLLKVEFLAECLSYVHEGQGLVASTT